MKKGKLYKNPSNKQMYKKLALGGVDDSEKFFLGDIERVNDGSIQSTTNSPNNTLGSNWQGIVSEITPYLSNIINSTRKIPKPSAPQLESNTNRQTVSFDADRNSLYNNLRSTTRGIDYKVANPTVGQALKNDAFSRLIEGNNQLSQQEKNINANLAEANSNRNVGIGARNTERQNEFLDNLTAQKIAQQRFNAENFADLSNKVQLSNRDKSLMALEGRKISATAKQYEDTGVYNRNLETLSDDALKALGYSDLEIKNIKTKKLGGSIKLKHINLNRLKI